MPVGTLVLPDPDDVRDGVAYGANGSEYVGRLAVPVAATGAGAMTDIEASVFNQLAGYAPLVALIGDRIYPGEADPDAPRPLVVYSLESTETTRGITGSIDWRRHTFAVTADAINKDDAKAVAAVVKDALDRQAFGVARRAYWADESANETGDGYEAVQTFTIIQ